MPNKDPKISPFEDAVASWARTPGSALRLIGHPLSLQAICESQSALPDLCPSSEPDTNGRRADAASACTSLLSGTV